jgi:hypothetical protein
MPGTAVAGVCGDGEALLAVGWRVLSGTRPGLSAGCEQGPSRGSRAGLLGGVGGQSGAAVSRWGLAAP